LPRNSPFGDKLRIVDQPCDECPFTGQISLADGRLKQIVDECHARAAEKPFLCHKTSGAGRVEGQKAAVCRGFHDRYPNCSQIQQVAVRLDLVEYVPAPQGTNWPSVKVKK
jgi:hypothetical protein